MAASASPVYYLLLAYNEEESIGSLIDELRAVAPPGEIIVVDDGSLDGTADIAEARNAIVLRLPVNLGIGGAFQAGLLYAKRLGANRLVRLDGDGQHDPASIPALLEVLDSGAADLVIGSRFLTESGGYRSTVTRRLGIRVISALNRMVTGKRIYDCTSGYLAMSGAMVAHLADVVPDDYPEPELLVLASKAGFEVSEVAIRMRPRGGGESSIRFTDSAVFMLKVILAILVSASKKTKRRDS